MADEIEGGEGEANIIVPKDQAVNNQPNQAPKDDANNKAAPVPTAEEIKAAADKEVAAAASAKAAEEEAEKNSDGTWKEAYIDIPDPAAQSVINLLSEAGVSPVEANSIFEEAIKADDLSKIKWDVLEARLGKDKTALAKIGITDYFNREYSKNVATSKLAHETMGGKDGWNKVATWVRATETADPSRKAEFDELRKGIDLGGRYAKQALTDMRALYEKAPGNNGLGGTKALTAGDKPQVSIGEPLSRASYVAELSKHGDNISAPIYADLQARRKAGRAAGI